jgi:prepilin-type N-terminal cleavage/methylation domain-containing protein
VRAIAIGRRSARRPAARASGFTLVELLVVIGIIAILIAILVPVLSKARAAANRAVCLSNIRQLGAGVLMYCNDNKGWFPTCAYWADGVGYIQYPDDWLHWQNNRNLMDSAIAKYLTRGKGSEALKTLLRCPADTFDGRRPGLAILPGQGPYMYSYGMNEGVGRNHKPMPGWRTKITQWRSVSRKILLTENLERDNTTPVWGPGSQLARRHGIGISHGNIVTVIPSNGNLMGVNVSAAFIDGHAEGINDDFACRQEQSQWWVNQ